MTQDDLIRKMTGRAVNGTKENSKQVFNEPVLRVQNINLKNTVRHAANVLTDISFTLHKGEIVGLYGLMGAGRTELMETLFGLHPKRATGNIFVNEQPVNIQTPIQCHKAGYCVGAGRQKGAWPYPRSEDKDQYQYHHPEPTGEMGHRIAQQKRNKSLERLYTTAGTLKHIPRIIYAGNLSGGNQQKIVLAKWLATNPAYCCSMSLTRYRHQCPF